MKFGLINLNKLWLVVFLLAPLLSFSQNKYLNTKKADRFILNSEFDKGIDIYKKILKKDSTYYKANFELANTYYYLGNYDSSIVYYLNCIKYSQKDTNFYAYYGYANCLRLQNKPKEALNNYRYFENKYKFSNHKNDQRLKIDLSINKEYCKRSILKNHQINRDIIITNLGENVNTSESEYGSVFLQDDSSFIFIGRYKDYNKEFQFEDDNYFENIYRYNYPLNRKEIFNKFDNQYTHLAVVGNVLSSDSLIVYYENKLWILNINNIKSLIDLPKELQGFYQQPSGVFSKDQKTFYFSARLDKTDDLDIYRSYKQKDGTWSPPSIVKELSSEYDDDSPFLTDNDTTLYFSSKGFNSSGDYDIYQSTYSNNKWSTPISLDYPINSPSDDIYYSIDHNHKSYLSSNRIEGYGLMDIYEIQMPPKPNFNCDTFPNTNLTVKFDVLGNEEFTSEKLKYKWVFDDGEVLYGPLVSKTFLFPGQHKINITIIDEEAGIIEENEVIEYINIDSVNYIGFSYPNYILKDSNVVFNSDLSYINDMRITNYYWRINDTIIYPKDTSIINHSFESLGNNKLDLQINALDKNNQYHSYCYTKILDVISLTDLPKNRNDSLNKNDYFLSSDSLENFFTKNVSIIDSLDFEPIYFGFDKSYLTKKAKIKLDSLLLFLEVNTDVNIIVSGHTDSKGSDNYNVSLSKRRIKSTLKYLKNHGLSSDRIYKTVAYGETKPIEPNELPNGSDNIKGRKKNRRVEFIIFKKNE